MLRFRRIINELLPPFLYRVGQRFNRRSNRYIGSFDNWGDAIAGSSGYDSELILREVSNATMLVKEGHAAFERDSIVFHEPEYSWAIVSNCLYEAVKNNGRLNVMDFGGSLGGCYYQNRKYFLLIEGLQWVVVEQDNFVKEGNERFADSRLFFCNSLEAYSGKYGRPDIVVMGCVMQYLQDPYAVLQEIMSLSPTYIIIERTPFTDTINDRLTIQKVPENIYRASYPAWFFSQTKFDRFILNSVYSIACKYGFADRANIPSTYQGFILEKSPV